MTLPLELGAIQDPYIRRAFEQIAQQVPWTGANVTGLTTTNLSATAGVLESQLANGATGLAKGAFSAYRNGASTLATGAVVPFETEEWDVNNWFDAVTTSRYTPQVAGYYRLNWVVRMGALAADQWCQASLAKNGTKLKEGQVAWQRITVNANTIGSCDVVANGTTDFFTVIIEHNVGAGTALTVGQTATYFQGELIGRS